MWRDLLISAVTTHNKTKVAENLGVSRTTISLIMHDKYPADTRRIAKRVMDIYGKVSCPHLEQEISQTQCRDYHTAEPPISSPRAMKHWRACQNCRHNELNQNKEEL